MNAFSWKKLIPHGIAILIFLVVSIVYCQPAIQGKVLEQQDYQGWRGMAQQSLEFKGKHGHMPYWTNSMFSGMPAYTIAYETPNKINIGIFHNYIFTLGLPKPVNYFFLAALMAYFLMIVLGINSWIGVMGALAYAYSTFNAIIVSVGHDTQMICIAYAPAVLASLILLYQGKYLIGTVLMTLFTSMIIFQNHIQIAYYTAISGMILGVSFLVNSYFQKKWSGALKSSGLAILSCLIAVGVTSINLWPVREYTQETMRGGRSELTDTTNAKNKTPGGLDKDYAFAYSVGKTETFTFFIPRLYGGSSRTVINNQYRTEFKPGGALATTFSEKTGVAEDQALDYLSQLGISPYWGEQQPTSGPVYLGAVICFLFLLGIFTVRGWEKWWLVGAAAVGILLAWGKNLEGLNYFLFDHLPFFKKFRAPSMALVMPMLAFPTLASLALNQFIFHTDKGELIGKWKQGLYAVGVAFAIVLILYFSFDYTASSEKELRQNFAALLTQQLTRGGQASPQVQQQADEFGRSMVGALHKDRSDLLAGDLLRTFIFVGVVGAILFLFAKGKLKPMYAVAGILVLSSADLLSVATRYLNYDNFTDENSAEAVFQTNPAIEKIKADPDHTRFRVYDQNEFTTSTISYYFNSVGGYSPAKLGLYQDIISYQLAKGNMNVFNMLNTKYFIVRNPSNGQPEARLNPDALGNCWFVKGYSFAKNADDEMKQLSTLNTKDSAVIDQRFGSVAGPSPSWDSAASIQMVENLNDKITYKTHASKPQFAVFSEVYYPHGWDSYIDGKLVPYCRVNYVLRGMAVPAGEHTIEFRFEPKTVIVSDRISMASSILLYLMIFAGLILEYRRVKKGLPLA